MKKVLAFTLATLFAGPALAQQPPTDPAFMARAISVLQAQRNQALDNAAGAQAKAEQLTEDLAKAQARIKELEAKPAATPDSAKLPDAHKPAAK